MRTKRNRKRATHCRRGHEFTPENTYVRTRGDGRVTHECVKCKAARRALRKPYDRKQYLTVKYGITNQDYSILLNNQNGVCAICGEDPGDRRLSIDHDHQTGRIRGLLCRNCNSGIGLLKDNAQILARASHYLTKT